jgi:hypothetical protein
VGTEPQQTNIANTLDSVEVVLRISLRSLAEKNPIALYELVEKARNPKHQFFGNTEEVLKQYALVGSD